MNYKTVVCASIVLNLASLAAEATVLSFSDKATFLSATGATSATGILPNLGLVHTPTLTVGGITFSGQPPVAGAMNFGTLGVSGVTNDDWTLRLPGPDLALGGVNEDLNVTLASGIFSFGFDFVEPENDPNVNSPFIDSTFVVSLISGALTVGGATFVPPNDIASFFGIWSDTPFDRVEIREVVGSNDNEFFGQFYSGVNPLSVPEPATWALILAGIAVLARVRREVTDKIKPSRNMG